MDITVTKIDSANATINAAITRARVDATMDRMAKRLSQEAKIAGFRKGKVPLAVIKKNYAEKLLQDVHAQLFREALDNGLSQLAIDASSLMGEPQVDRFEPSEEGIVMEATIACRPMIELGEYKTLVPVVEKPVIEEDAINARIEEIASAQAELVSVDEDRPLVSGDVAVIDFEGFIEGVAFEGGKAEGHALTLGSGQFIPGFEDQVAGMRVGETKTIEVTFPESYGSQALAGKMAHFVVTVHAIQAKAAVVIDDALAQKLLSDESASVETLRAKIKEILVNEALGETYNKELKPALMEIFVNALSIDLPRFVVEQEMDMALNKKASSMSEEEIAALREDREALNVLRESFRAEAQRAVKATFVIDALAKAEAVHVSEQEVMQTIYYEAFQMGQDPAGMYKYYQESGFLPAIQMAMIEDRVLSQLLNETLKED